MTKATVLLVDDDPLFCETMEGGLRAVGFDQVYVARNGVDALDQLQTIRVDIALVDVVMPYMDGITLITKLKVKHPNVKVIGISGVTSEDFFEGMFAEDIPFIEKPFNASQVAERIDSMVDAQNGVAVELPVSKGIREQAEHVMKEGVQHLENIFCYLSPDTNVRVYDCEGGKVTGYGLFENPKESTMGRFLIPEGVKFPEHTHGVASWEHFIVISGELLVNVDGAEIVLQANETYSVPPNVPHFAQGLKETWMYACLIPWGEGYPHAE